LKFYGYKKCSSCRQAETFLSKAGIAYEFIDITEHPPSASELTKIVALSGLELKKFLNTSGELYRSMGLKVLIKDYSEAEVIDMLSRHGRLIKRPLLVDGTRSTVGFGDDVRKTWSSGLATAQARLKD
jgi:arsenate reductase